MTASPARRAAAWAFGLHAGLIVFATLAMITILAGEFPVWMQGPYTPRIYELGWRFTGQAYVLLGVAAALLHAGPRFGWTRAAVVFACASLIALSSELLGTNIGVPFGAYRYTEMLGYRIGGDVPYVIPLSWSYMLYASLGMCGRILAPREREQPWRWAIVAGLMLTAWDVGLEVHMTSVNPPHWVWEYNAMPAWLPDWLARPAYYGMPIINWIGWIVTATIVARVMLAIVPPRVWRATVSPAALPLALYAANGIMPVATLARHGMVPAAIIGAVAMAVPIALSMRMFRSSFTAYRDTRPQAHS